MNYIVIKKKEFTKNKILYILKKYLYENLKNKNTIIFDIHNTIEYDDNKIDKIIFNFIKINHNNLNIILLSYDGNDRRIINNNNILDDYSKIFTKIPKIFIKKRKKHYIIGYIYKLLINKFGSYKKSMYFFDDNYLNILDAKKIKKSIPSLNIIHYSVHSKKPSIESIYVINDILQKILP